MTLTEAHLKKLPDADLRTIALRIVTDALNALDTNIEDHDLDDHPTLDPAPVHGAADWLHEILTNPDHGYNRDTRERHSAAVRVFRDAAFDIGKATTGNGSEFPPQLNAAAVDLLLLSVACGGGTPHRPSVYWLTRAGAECGHGFMPSHETGVGYALNAICGPADPRLPALAESYMQSGLHVNLRPAINRATRQLAHLDELAELNR